MHHPDLNAPPINPLPPLVILLAIAIAGPEIVFQLASAGVVGGKTAIGWRTSSIETLGFFDQLFDYMRSTGNYSFRSLARFLTYPFVHFSGVHAGFAVVMILALGKMVAEKFSAVATVILFAASSVVGALCYGLFLETRFPLIGAYPAVYGFLGAYTWILWLHAGADGSSRLRAFSLVAMLLGLQLLFQIFFGGRNDWIADLGGFCTGFALSPVLDPGGAGRIRGWIDRMRQR